MTTRSFIKAALALPITSIASILDEKKYGFNFIGDAPINDNVTDFHVHSYDLDRSLHVLLHAHYADGVLFHKRAIEIFYHDTPYKDIILQDALFSEMTVFNRPSVETGRSFMTLKEYHKYPTPFMEKLNMRLKQNKYTVDVYTDFSSFKHMMDTKYKGDYTQEFLDDIKRLQF